MEFEMRNWGASKGRRILAARARILRPLGVVLVMAGLMAAWTLSIPSQAGATAGSSGSSLLTSVSCTSTSTCIVLGAGGQGWSDSGSAWSAATPVDSSGTLSSVSCASATFCVAVDYTGQAVTFDGTSWSTPTLVDTSGFLSSVSCASATFCVAVDYAGHAVTFDGTTWSAPVLIDSSGLLSSVSCATSSSCVAVDYTGQAVAFDGTTWDKPQLMDTVRHPLLVGLMLVKHLLCRRELLREMRSITTGRCGPRWTRSTLLAD